MTLYIHIPFCTAKCGYCAFSSFVDKDNLIKPYIKALVVDLKYQFAKIKPLKINSIFFGGGTPSVLSVDDFELIFLALDEVGALRNTAEITVEANPDVSLNLLQNLKNLGVNRLSIGAQSFSEEKLRFLQRDHSAKLIHLSVANAHKAGIDNINVDFIYDTKVDTPSIIESDFKIARSLDLTHISAYSLSIDRGSSFYKSKENLKSSTTFMPLVADCLLNYGFLRYEASNFVKGLKSICKHNLSYWQGEEYLGVGLSSVGRIGSVRTTASKSLNHYISLPTFRREENLSDDDMALEALFLGLRTIFGVRLPNIKINKNNLDILLKEGIVEVLKEGDQEILRAKNLNVADEITLFLMED